MKQRLDRSMVARGLVATRSQAESWIRLGRVTVDGAVQQKPGYFVAETADVQLKTSENYVSRAGLKLASVANDFALDFTDKIVLDVGSSTGGFTDYALQHGARRVIAVDVGTDQFHPKLRGDNRVELHEKTDIRDFYPEMSLDLVLIDVSFISLRQVLPHIAKISSSETVVVAMMKPQFEAARRQLTSGGIVKNKTIRREIIHDFEDYLSGGFRLLAKKDSQIKGAKGNLERFYSIKPLQNNLGLIFT